VARSQRENARLTREIELRRDTEKDLRELSERDPLTGLPNRRAWDRAVAGALRHGVEPIHGVVVAER
jgi:GGDEF domain-containing protein